MGLRGIQNFLNTPIFKVRITYNYDFFNDVSGYIPLPRELKRIFRGAFRRIPSKIDRDREVEPWEADQLRDKYDLEKDRGQIRSQKEQEYRRKRVLALRF